MIDDPALMAVFLADLNHWADESADRLPSIVANRLIDSGHPEIAAVRVALTPPMSLSEPTSNGGRAGREIDEAVDGNLGKVVRLVVAQIGGAP